MIAPIPGKLAGILIASAAVLLTAAAPVRADIFSKFESVETNDGSGISWDPRAGLQAVNHRGQFYVLGGRKPNTVPLAFGDSVFFNDVWKSNDSGQTWDLVPDGNGAPWAARAYFQAVSNGGYVYVTSRELQSVNYVTG